jgi:signal transduction histidine kinase
MLFALQKAVLYVKNHPQILFVLILLIAFPLLFLYTGQQFLDVGRANQERLQKDRVGLMHDVFSSLLSATDLNTEIIQTEFDKVVSLNPDILDYKVSTAQGSDIVPVAALRNEDIGISIEDDAELYRNATVRLDESIIFETYTGDGRTWRTYRAVEGKDASLYFIYTELSMKMVDDLFASRERSAYFSLIFVYFFIIALALWHIKLTDYRYLYIHAKKANETKDLFTNMIAHELRAPLTAIKGYASLLDEQLQDAEQKKYASRVKESSERLITIVNDLLDVARIQSGKLSITAQEIDLSEVVTSVIDELRISAKEKNILLTYTKTQDHFNVTADKKRLHQALTNLVSNAIKYTQNGAIELSIEEKSAYIEVRVKDTGMGISAEDQKKLFAPFFRVANEDVSKITGTGLGMWITKQLIELMGATIGVESIKGVGTHIVISIPKAHSQKQP